MSNQAHKVHHWIHNFIITIEIKRILGSFLLKISRDFNDLISIGVSDIIKIRNRKRNKSGTESEISGKWQQFMKNANNL